MTASMDGSAVDPRAGANYCTVLRLGFDRKKTPRADEEPASLWNTVPLSVEFTLSVSIANKPVFPPRYVAQSGGAHVRTM